MRAAAILFLLTVSAAPAMAQTPAPPEIDFESVLKELLLRVPPPQGVMDCRNMPIEGASCDATPGITRPVKAIDGQLIGDMLGYIYPRSSMLAREEGDVRAMMCIDANGRSQNVKIIESSRSKALDDASLVFFKQLPFNPATLEGKPVAFCNYTFTMQWRLPPLPSPDAE